MCHLLQFSGHCWKSIKHLSLTISFVRGGKLTRDFWQVPLHCWNTWLRNKRSRSNVQACTVLRWLIWETTLTKPKSQLKACAGSQAQRDATVKHLNGSVILKSMGQRAVGLQEIISKIIMVIDLNFCAICELWEQITT